MKKQVAGISFIVVALSIILSSYRAGPARNGWDCTGAETGLQNPAGCSSGNGCHAVAADTLINVVIELDSAGIPVTNYVGGKSYTVKLSGTNNTTSTLRGYGFQIGSIEGSTAQVTPVNTGTWGTPPSQTHYQAAQPTYYVVNVVEQSTTISPTTGTGATGSTYVKSFPWTAPVAGTGTISFWAALNCVNGNNNNDHGDLWNVANLVVNEEDTAVVLPNGVLSVSQSIDIKLFPNPVNEILNLQWNNAVPENYSLTVFNIAGQIITTENTDNDNSSNNITINTANWKPGIYLVSLQTANARQSFRVAKQ